MVLFHNIISIWAGSTTTSPPQLLLLLQFRDHFRVRRVAVYGDNPRPGMTRSPQGFLEELLRRCSVTLSGKPKVDRGARGIHGTIQVPAPANVRLVNSPGAVGRFQFAPISLVRFGCAAPSAKRWCGPQGALVPRAIPRRLDRKARTADTNGIHCSLSDPFSQFLQHCPYLRARRSGECT